jgi:PKHD-type hydroxylase
MIVTIENLLTPDEVAGMLERLNAAAVVDGRVTAGRQSALAKNNLQLPEGSPAASELGAAVLQVLRRNPTFASAALPLKVFPPLFNRYDEGMRFDPHIDNAIRFSETARYRTDLSATLFLSDPEDYDGGALIVSDTYGEHAVKLTAGALVLYPAASLHRVAAITRGRRWASFFWVQSMVRDDGQRSLLYKMDQSIQSLSARCGPDDKEVLALTGTYHNLIRMWADV